MPVDLEPIKTTDVDGRAVFAYVIQNMEIVDPTVSECARFDVEPDYYGLTIEQVARLALLNQAMRG
jgi:hypothetical protein